MVQNAKCVALIALCFLCALVMALPLTMAQSPGLPYSQPSTLSAVDAVQNEQLRSLDIRTTSNSEVIASMDSKINWILGGIVGMNALLGLIGMFNFRQIRSGK